ncbi:MAG TPA: hypothetical protein VG710_11680, partial [Opitutus sp.]|nr:hypothetical protein [Opitutus sp.]
KLRKNVRSFLAFGATNEAGFAQYWRHYRQSHPAIAGQWGLAGAGTAWDSLTLDDLNVPLALGFIFKVAEVRENPAKGSYKFENEVANLSQLMFALGLDLFSATQPRAEAPFEIVALAENRWAAKQAKDFATADALRKEIAAAGWSMLDRKDGYSLEPAKK